VFILICCFFVVSIQSFIFFDLQITLRVGRYLLSYQLRNVKKKTAFEPSTDTKQRKLWTSKKKRIFSPKKNGIPYQSVSMNQANPVFGEMRDGHCRVPGVGRFLVFSRFQNKKWDGRRYSRSTFFPSIKSLRILFFWRNAPSLFCLERRFLCFLLRVRTVNKKWGRVQAQKAEKNSPSHPTPVTFRDQQSDENFFFVGCHALFFWRAQGFAFVNLFGLLCFFFRIKEKMGFIPRFSRMPCFFGEMGPLISLEATSCVF